MPGHSTPGSHPMSIEPTHRLRRTKRGIGNSNLGQFRIMAVHDGPHHVLALDRPEAIVEAWHEHVAASPWFDSEKEHLVVFVLDGRLVLKGWNVVSIGTVNEAMCHPRDVLRPVLVAAGYGFVMAHNHPSGDPSPSRADHGTTRRLDEAGKLVGTRLLDHVVVGRNRSYFSFREAGLVT
jgi:DNA repair protein RadC